MGSKPIEFQAGRLAWLGLTAAAVLVAGACQLTAADSAAPDLRDRKATQRAVSSASASSVEWTASDFAAIGLMVLGAAVVFIPLPKWRSRKSVVAADSATKAPGTTSVDVTPSIPAPAPAPARAETPPATLVTAESLVNSRINPTPVSS